MVKICEKEYLNSLISMQLNGEYVAAYMGVQLQLHSVNFNYFCYNFDSVSFKSFFFVGF
jgi:hypothetical protein